MPLGCAGGYPDDGYPYYGPSWRVLDQRRFEPASLVILNISGRTAQPYSVKPLWPVGYVSSRTPPRNPELSALGITSRSSAHPASCVAWAHHEGRHVRKLTAAEGVIRLSSTGWKKVRAFPSNGTGERETSSNIHDEFVAANAPLPGSCSVAARA